MERKLARLAAPDHRDRLFGLMPPKANSDLKYKFWYTSPAYDQGSTSQCVAYSGIKYLDSAPIRNRDFALNVGFSELYHRCQLIDEWPGENYDGTSVRALFKILKEMGYIQEYRWAFDIPTMVQHVLTTGPMVVGTDWHTGMYSVDGRGFIHPTGRSNGGHAYMIKGVNTRTVCPDGTIGAFRIINSWGIDWGVNGCASISFAAFAQLLARGGDACCATEIQK
ncbi:MAG: hypothetical protein HC888_01780 [Candidatus Competibacteraceae bacterium]|nr:hypothetical protein [Candidatus Competibacteraceae bacterium]